MRVLVVDDEPALRRSVRAYLEDLDHQVLEAENGQMALEILATTPVDVALVDLNMPVLDGYAVIEATRRSHPEMPTVVISGVGVVEEALRAVRLGAWDYITKPIRNFDLLLYTLNKVMERAALLRENRRHQEHLEELVTQRTRELERTRRQIMQRLSRAAEYKDNETGNHVMRVGEISAVLGRAMGLSEERCLMLRDCAPLHDIGKIGIPDAVLLKPGKLDPEEWAIMQRHCFYGCEILSSLKSRDEARKHCLHFDETDPDDNELLHLARILALLHHERWDGSGYPLGLKGEHIPIEARIVALVDVYDALSSERPYKPAFPEERCLAIIAEGRCTHFDPAIVDAFFQHIEEIRAIHAHWQD
ncbi:two-component system response regulator [Thermodesulfomicrobium sp. WS]|uniref:HD-GYP domain-containing protein n=1 Tax=Thermodesulfomicrobium sp. WS TaxID=3004129 RepID=UPI002491E80A|nr:HD domain-containing phosphohydrolase [Thermodesulfomicrobium sp. WS]BDV01865.1 two-component system response regulator [Thermodesulfomicrobium sp. WS]